MHGVMAVQTVPSNQLSKLCLFEILPHVMRLELNSYLITLGIFSVAIEFLMTHDLDFVGHSSWREYQRSITEIDSCPSIMKIGRYIA